LRAAEEFPVTLCSRSNGADGARQSSRHRERNHDQARRRRGRGAEDIVDSAHGQNRLVSAACGGQHKRRQRFAGRSPGCVGIVHPGTDFGVRGSSVTRHGILHNRLIVVVDYDKAAGESDAMASHDAKRGENILLLQAPVECHGTGK